jgi:hypothetical protein
MGFLGSEEADKLRDVGWHSDVTNCCTIRELPKHSY